MNLKILDVDDEVDIAQIIQELVQRLGCTAQVASNTKEALAKLDHEHFDIIFTDLHMPGENGVVLAQKIRQGPRLYSKIVAITGDCITPEFQYGEIYRYIDGRLIKPFTSRQIKETLRLFQTQNDRVQRQCTRHRVFMEAQVIVGEKRISGRIISVGTHGAFFHSEKIHLFPEEGENVILEIPANSLLTNNLGVSGKCCWARKKMDGPWPSGVGILFDQAVLEFGHLKTDYYEAFKVA